MFSQDDRTDKVSGLSLPICGLLIPRGTSDMGLSYGDTRWFCLLSSAAAGSAKDGALAWDWTNRAWIIGEESSGTLVSWVNNACTCVVIAMFGPNGLSGLR